MDEEIEEGGSGVLDVASPETHSNPFNEDQGYRWSPVPQKSKENPDERAALLEGDRLRQLQRVRDNPAAMERLKRVAAGKR